jgi:hypothetical protein
MAQENEDRILEGPIAHEGGYSNDPDDPGNWTGGKVGVGRLLGTKFGIAAKGYDGSYKISPQLFAEITDSIFGTGEDRLMPSGPASRVFDGLWAYAGRAPDWESSITGLTLRDRRGFTKPYEWIFLDVVQAVLTRTTQDAWRILGIILRDDRLAETFLMGVLRSGIMIAQETDDEPEERTPPDETLVATVLEAINETPEAA